MISQRGGLWLTIFYNMALIINEITFVIMFNMTNLLY